MVTDRLVEAFALAALFSAAPIAQVVAQDVSLLTATSLDAFYGACLNETFSLSVTVPFIETLGWEEIDAATTAIFAPPAEQEYLKGWVAIAPDAETIGQGLPFFLVLGRPKDREKNVETCTAFFRMVDPVEFVPAFIEETRATEIARVERFSEVTVSYQVPDNPDILVSLHYGVRSDARDITASAIHLNQPEFTP